MCSSHPHGGTPSGACAKIDYEKFYCIFELRFSSSSNWKVSEEAFSRTGHSRLREFRCNPSPVRIISQSAALSAAPVLKALCQREVSFILDPGRDIASIDVVPALINIIYCEVTPSKLCNLVSHRLIVFFLAYALCVSCTDLLLKTPHVLLLKTRIKEQLKERHGSDSGAGSHALSVNKRLRASNSARYIIARRSSVRSSASGMSVRSKERRELGG